MTADRIACVRCDGRSHLGNPCRRALSAPITAAAIRRELKRRGWIVNFLNGHMVGRHSEGVLDFCPTHSDQARHA